MGRSVRTAIVLCALGGAALARPADRAARIGGALDWPQELAVRDSLRQVPPKWRGDWLRRRGIDWPGCTSYRQPDTGQGLRLVGKWGRGRAWEVDGQGSIVALALGSEVALVSFANPDEPALLSEIQLDYLPAQVILRDSLLLTGRNGIDILSVADAVHPERLAHIPCFVSDFALVDSLLYFVSGDSFYSYNIVRPASPARIGACRDSGHVATATAGVAVLRTDNSMAFIDVTNPAAPQRVGTYGGWALSAAARGNVCYATFSNPGQLEQSWLSTIDITDPSSPHQLGRRDSVCSFDIQLQGPYLFTAGRAGYEPMQILSIADSANPAVVGSLRLSGEGGWGVWADPAAGRAFIATDWAGIRMLDITNLAVPTLDTVLLPADMAHDISVDGDRAYVADYRFSLKILDISDPTNPQELGGIDSAHVASEAVVARDSFAYVEWSAPVALRSICVTDPTRPTLAGGGAAQTLPSDMVLRDTLLYVAGRLRFNVLNVARPRQPVLVGSCVIQGTGTDLTLVDSLAYVSSLPSSIISVSDPANPRVIGTLPMCAYGIVVTDTFATASDGGDSLIVYSVSNPTAPRWLSSVALPGAPQYTMDIELVGTKLYTTGSYVHVLDVSDPVNPRDLGRWRPPYAGRRIAWSAPYLYTACWDAGVCILETLPVGISEQAEQARRWSPLRVHPNPTGSEIVVCPDNVGQHRGLWTVRDVAGRVVRSGSMAAGTERLTLDMTAEPAGVYVIELEVNGKRHRGRVVKL
jgi:hypothetical protein